MVILERASSRPNEARCMKLFSCSISLSTSSDPHLESVKISGGRRCKKDISLDSAPTECYHAGVNCLNPLSGRCNICGHLQQTCSKRCSVRSFVRHAASLKFVHIIQ